MPVDIVEMLWECTHCKETVLGRYKECQKCGKTKSTKCREWLPDDVSHTSASIVTDTNLHDKFVAGSDWQCRYCQSLEWRVDGTCANCGSDQSDSPASNTSEKDDDKQTNLSTTSATVANLSEVQPSYKKPLANVLSLAIGIAIAFALIMGLFSLFRTVQHPATVSETHWIYAVDVEREQIVTHDGFHPSGGAFNIHPLGMRTIRYESVLDHYDNVSYSYQEACGQTCTPIPRTCRTTPRTCKSNKNGSATCSGGDQVCSGGGQSCSTKYCSKTGTRREARYRKEPVNQMYYSWEQWDWIFNRTVQTEGVDATPIAPSAEKINLGDRERKTSSLKMIVTFCNDDDHKCNTYAPESTIEFSTLSVGAKRNIRVNTLGFITIVVEPASRNGSYLYPGYNHT